MIVFVCLTFFFFKQKTAYEMRISDWSSDVCSSDLTLGHPAGDALLKQVAQRLLKIVGDREMVSRLGGDEFQIILPDIEDRGKLEIGRAHVELQSLMRISYAVFCLKQKNTTSFSSNYMLSAHYSLSHLMYLSLVTPY